MTRRPSTGWALVVVAVTVVGLVAGLGSWFKPANRLRRALDRVEMPDSVRHEGGEVTDNGWVCFDSCSDAVRYYVTDLPPAEAAPLVERALRRAGLRGRMEPCVSHGSRTWCRLGGPDAYAKGVAEYRMSFEGGYVHGWARVGRREDGRYGVEVAVIPS